MPIPEHQEEVDGPLVLATYFSIRGSIATSEAFAIGSVKQSQDKGGRLEGDMSRPYRND